MDQDDAEVVAALQRLERALDRIASAPQAARLGAGSGAAPAGLSDDVPGGGPRIAAAAIAVRLDALIARLRAALDSPRVE